MNTPATALLLLFLKGLLAFVSTNIDDLLLLIIFLRKNDLKTNRKHIILSQYLSFLIIITISILASFSKFILPLRVIGLLGLVPILYGIRKLFPKKPDHKLDANLTIFMMTTLALGDGLDNISTYTTLFASETFVHVCILTGYFFFLLAIWYYIASTLAHFRMITLLTKKIDQSIPFIYLLLGAFIIYKNRTLTLLFEKVP